MRHKVFNEEGAESFKAAKKSKWQLNVCKRAQDNPQKFDSSSIEKKNNNNE